MGCPWDDIFTEQLTEQLGDDIIIDQQQSGGRSVYKGVSCTLSCRLAKGCVSVYLSMEESLDRSNERNQPL